MEVAATSESRYDRQRLIPWWEQDKLLSAKVLVVGAGALGNEVIKNLALLGVGSVLIVDLDRIERSNLARCVLFRDSDTGEFKAPVAAERARNLNPDVFAAGLVGDIRADVGLGVFVDADVVIGALDNRDARLMLNEACWKTGTPWVDGAIEGMMGEMRVFMPPSSIDYTATLGKHEKEDLERRRACTLLPPADGNEESEDTRVPTTATSAAVVAGMQVQEAVKILHREELDYEFGGRGFLFNGLNHDSYSIEYSAPRDHEPPVTYDLKSIESVTSEETFADIFDRWVPEANGGKIRLKFEREVVLGFACSRCKAEEAVMRPAKALKDEALPCPRCGVARRLELRHSITRSEDESVLALTPAEIGLPPGDVIAVQVGSQSSYLSTPFGERGFPEGNG